MSIHARFPESSLDSSFRSAGLWSQTMNHVKQAHLLIGICMPDGTHHIGQGPTDHLRAQGDYTRTEVR